MNLAAALRDRLQRPRGTAEWHRLPPGVDRDDPRAVWQRLAGRSARGVFALLVLGVLWLEWLTRRDEVVTIDHEYCIAATQQPVAEGHSVQCGGVALEQLLGWVEEQRDGAKVIGDWLSGVDALQEVADEIRRRSSGGQEGEVEECVIEGCELRGGHKGPHKAWRIIDAPYLEDREHVEPWEDEVAREIAAEGEVEEGHRCEGCGTSVGPERGPYPPDGVYLCKDCEGEP